MNPPRFVFFGTPCFAVTILEALSQKGYVPALIITGEDKPKGRGLVLTPPPVKMWGEAHHIPVIQPRSLKETLPKELTDTSWDVCIVCAYGAILPKNLLALPQHGIINVHPSLLPRFRGPSPIESQILSDEKKVGVSIMQIDEEVDHGPIISQEVVGTPEWPMRGSELEKLLGEKGGALLGEVLPEYLSGTLPGTPQNHECATFTKKIKKEDGQLRLTDDPYQNFLKIRAFDEWPGTFFFAKNKDGKAIRAKITDARFTEGTLHIVSVIPEGKREMPYTDFIRNYSL